MRTPSVFAVLLLILIPCAPRHAFATEIAGKWGLGLSVGELLDSRAEASIVRGRSASTAWILDLSLSGSTSDVQLQLFAPDRPPITSNGNQDNLAIQLGPRIRKYTRPDRALSPYWDIFAHGNFAWSDETLDLTSKSRGAEIGIDFGAEYFFTRWPISAAVHTTLANARYTHQTRDGNAGTYIEHATMNIVSGSVRINPALQVRAYF